MSTRPVVLRSAVVFPLAVAGVLLVGCAQEPREVPVPASSSPAPTATPTPTPTAVPAITEVPAFCEELLTPGVVAEVTGAGLPAGTGRLYNDDVLPSSGRTGQLVCSYGVEEDDDEPAVTITVASYETPEQAEVRVDMAIADARDESRYLSSTPLDGRPGQVITGGGTASYVVLAESLTLVVTLRSGVVPDPARVVVLTDLAGIALGITPAPGDDTD